MDGLRLLALTLGFFLLILTVVFAVAALVLLVDPDQYRGPLGRVLSAALGYPVRIEGSLQIDPGLTPRIEAAEVKIGGRSPGSTPIGRMGRLELEIELMRLLEGVLYLRWLGLSDVELMLAKNGGGDTPAGDARGGDAFFSLDLVPVVESARVEKLELTYPQAGPGGVTTLHLEKLMVSSSDQGAERVLEANGHVNGEPLVISGQFGPVAEFFRPTRPYPVSLKGELMSAQFELSGTVSEPTALRGIRMRLEASARELSDLLRLLHVDLPPIGRLTASMNLRGEREKMSLSEISLALGEGALLRATLEGEVRDVRTLQGVDLRLEAETSDLATLSPLFGRELPDSGGLRVRGRLTDHDGTLGIEELALGSEHEAVRIQIKGNFSHLRELDEIDLALELDARHLSALGDIFGAELPALGPVEISGTIVGANEKIELKSLVARLGGTRITGQAWASFLVGDRPEFAADLRSEQLQLADLGLDSAADAAGDGEGVRAKLARWVSDETELPLRWLGTFDGKLSLEVDHVSGRVLTLDRLKASAQLRGGTLEIAQFEAELGGGQVKGTARLAAGSLSPSVWLRARATGVDLGRISQQREGGESLAGTVDAALELESTGSSSKAVVSGLSGQIAVALRRGRLEAGTGVFLNTQRLRSLLFQGPRWDQTPMTCFAGQWGLRSGVARIDALLYQTKDTIVIGEGTLDLVSQRIDLVLVPTPLDPKLFSLATAVNLSGPLASPSTTLDKTLTAKSVARASLGGVGWLLPFVSAGKLDEKVCEQLAEQIATHGILDAKLP